MNFFLNKNTYLRRKFFALFLSFFLLLPFLGGCKKEIDYFEYVSELRSNIFVAKTEDFSLRVYAVTKETPYATDGLVHETSDRLEAYLVAPSGDKTVQISLSVNGETMGGEMSFDNVKREYYYYRTCDVSSLSALECTLLYGEEEIKLTASSVRKENTLSPKAALKKLTETKSELFNELTDEYGFAGEIYLRLIYEDHAYYYVGVIDREGKINAFLLNAQTGEILATREG